MASSTHTDVLASGEKGITTSGQRESYKSALMTRHKDSHRKYHKKLQQLLLYLGIKQQDIGIIMEVYGNSSHSETCCYPIYDPVRGYVGWVDGRMEVSYLIVSDKHTH